MGDDEVVRRVMGRVASFRESRDLDAVLSGDASEDLRRLYELPQDIEVDFAIAWLCYCRFLGLGSTAGGEMKEALSRFLAPGRYSSRYLPRSVALLRDNITDVDDPASPRHRTAVVLTGAEARIEAVRLSSAPGRLRRPAGRPGRGAGRATARGSWPQPYAAVPGAGAAGQVRDERRSG